MESTIVAPAGVGTWLEILPVFGDAAGLQCLRPCGEQSWRLPYRGGRAVQELVLARLAGADLDPAVVHSTSWRQERDGAVLLSHLAVLRTASGVAPPLEPWPVRRRELARGTAVDATAFVDVGQVVEHALRHLAWLADDDEAVRLALCPGWLERLADYRPEPFRMFAARPGALTAASGRPGLGDGTPAH